MGREEAITEETQSDKNKQPGRVIPTRANEKETCL